MLDGSHNLAPLVCGTSKNLSEHNAVTQKLLGIWYKDSDDLAEQIEPVNIIIVKNKTSVCLISRTNATILIRIPYC